MTKEEAKKAVDAYVDSIKDTSFSLKGANGSFDATAQEMCIRDRHWSLKNLK